MAKTKPNTRASERAIRTPRADSHRERAAVLAPSDDTGIQKTTKKKKQLSSKQKQRRKERARRGAVFIEKLASKRDASVQKSRVVHERRDDWSVMNEKISDEVEEALARAPAVNNKFAELFEAEQAMRALKYEGDILRYINRLQLYNSRVRMTGVSFREMVLDAMPPEILNMIDIRVGAVPEEDDKFMAAIKQAGQIVDARRRG